MNYDSLLATSLNVRSSQTIFIRILCTSQFVKTVSSEAFFEFLEIRNLNFYITKIGNLQEKLVNSQSWQGHKDLNPEPTVLETAALPIELYPYVLFISKAIRLNTLVGLQGFEPGTIRL